MGNGWPLLRAAVRLCTILCLVGALPQYCFGYSVLTHEQLVDLTWKNSIRPLLLNRFPGTTEAGLLEAHAYAYGGCAIQDAGYYPFGKAFFSDLTHYVRSGDFVASLFRNAKTVNEYAFAIGALSHYLGDTIGHHDAINLATAVAFPKLGKKYGTSVNYGENPHAHIRTEFAFDIGELSRERLAPGAYLRHVGLRVPRHLLERAFFETYALHLREVLGPEIPAIKSYRSAVRNFIPRFAHAETVIHRNHFPPDNSDDAFEIFAKRLSQADFANEWQHYRHKASLETRLLAVLIRIVPKVGPAADLAIKIPTSQTKDWYVQSLNRTIDALQKYLDFRANARVVPDLANRDLDTGDKVAPGAYRLTDQTYANLLERLTSNPNRHVPQGLRQDILDYYSNLNAPIATKKNDAHWKRVLEDLESLKTMPSISGEKTED